MGAGGGTVLIAAVVHNHGVNTPSTADFKLSI